MAYNYKGDGGKDVVYQNNTYDYDAIRTYGGADEINLKLGQTYVDAGTGDDVVRSNIENENDIYLGDGNDTYTGTGFQTNSNRFDLVYGGNGQDTFNISTSVSEYYGEGGNDLFNSVGYSNYLNGGSGVDTVSYLRQDNDSYLSGQGVEIDLYNEYAFTGGNREEVLVNFENAKGTSYGDTVIGDYGNNKLWGMNGNDILDGLGGKDTLYGGNGSDDLYGGGNADRLIGGRGTDVLEGGSGADFFIFQVASDSAVGSKRDVITDFTRGEGDRIDLSDIDAIQGGGDSDFDYIGAAKFSGTAGELRFQNELLQGDTNGDGKADFEIKVEDYSKLLNGDFIL